MVYEHIASQAIILSLTYCLGQMGTVEMDTTRSLVA